MTQKYTVKDWRDGTFLISYQPEGGMEERWIASPAKDGTIILGGMNETGFSKTLNADALPRFLEDWVYGLDAATSGLSVGRDMLRALALSSPGSVDFVPDEVDDGEVL